MDMSTMMSHERPIDPMAMMSGGYGMGGAMVPPSSMSMNTMMGGYGGMSPMHGIGPQAPNMSGYGVLPQRSHRMPANLSAVQMKLLTCQIKAYRYLARNMPLPEHLRAFITSHATNVSSRNVGTPPPVTTSPVPPVNQGSSNEMPSSSSASFHSPPVAKQHSTPPPSFQSVNKPQTSTASSQLTNQVTEKVDATKSTDTSGTSVKGHTQLKQVKLAPIPKPKGLDPEVIMKEREAR